VVYLPSFVAYFSFAKEKVDLGRAASGEKSDRRTAEEMIPCLRERERFRFNKDGKLRFKVCPSIFSLRNRREL
jgi:hypothetical protein